MDFDKIVKLLDKEQQYIARGPFSLRKTFGLSAGTAHVMKYISDAWGNLSDSQKHQLRIKFASLGRFFDWLDRRSGAEMSKKSATNPAGVLKSIGDDIKSMMKSKIDDGADRLAGSISKSANQIYSDSVKLTPDEFAAKYYEKTPNWSRSMLARKFESSAKGKLLNAVRDNKLQQIIDRSVKLYRETESEKIDSMVYKLGTRLGDIQSYDLGRMRDRNVGGEFHLKVVLANGSIVDVETELIFAGGYNVQVLHTRWLMKFKQNGKQITITS